MTVASGDEEGHGLLTMEEAEDGADAEPPIPRNRTVLRAAAGRPSGPAGWRRPLAAAGFLLVAAIVTHAGSRGFLALVPDASSSLDSDTSTFFQLPHFNFHLPAFLFPNRAPPAYMATTTPPAAAPQADPGAAAGQSAAVSGQSYDCETGYHHKSNWPEGWTAPQQEWCCRMHQIGCPEPRRMSFYMYRAQSDADYPATNVNMGDLPGVLWYLHNEVIVSNPRKYDVTRIIRFRVTVKTTQHGYAMTHSQFGPFTAFDRGQCTVPTCDSIFQQNGYLVGCQNTDSSQGLGNYVSLQSVPCTPPNCKEGTWYSLPGPCPSYPLENKDYTCNGTSPGGQCQFVYGDGGVTGFDEAPVTGENDCTYYAKWAGQIHLNELIGLPPDLASYQAFWQAQNWEYNVASDAGVCTENYNCTFWNGRNDQEACAVRQRYIQDTFDAKFPFYPATSTLGESPPCSAA
mmetsp:Transcript_82392/g.233662  ORF Transcript_82392/g.233662 Transcript_82392/m.233662 type:complete len:457 (+) Transcript_82392:125-1495(+)